MRHLLVLALAGCTAGASSPASAPSALSVFLDGPPAGIDCIAFTLADEDGTVTTLERALQPGRIAIPDLAVGAYDLGAVAYASGRPAPIIDADCAAVPAAAPWTTEAPVPVVVHREQTTRVTLVLVPAGSVGAVPRFAPPSIDVPTALTVPTDPAAVVYPDDYLATPQSLVTVIDPICVIASDTVTFPAEWVGAFPLPPLRGAPLPAGVALGMTTKDFWAPGLTNPALEQGCHGDLHVAFADTVARLARLGASYVAVPSFDFLVDSTAAAPVFDVDQEQVGADDLQFIAQTAHAHGLAAHLVIQVSEPDDNGVNLPSAPTTAWFSAFLDAYTARVLRFAAECEAAGIDEMSLNWVEYFVDLANHPELDDLLAARLLDTLADVRAIYHGKVYYIEGNYAPARTGKAALLAALDEVSFMVPARELTADEDANPTVDLLVSKYRPIIDAAVQRMQGSGKPLVLAPFVQSHRFFLETGWIEESPGSPKCNVDCAQRRLSTDFSVQAIGYEAFLEATQAAIADGASIAAIEPPNYWYTDEIIPQGLFPNIGQTVRNKPAEVILYHWFAR